MLISRLPLLLPLLLLAVVPACRMAPLHMPEFAVDAPQEDVHDAILQALSGRGWAPIEQEDGRVRARLNLRSHQATIDIHYSSEQVRFEHVSSVNLNERRDADGDVHVHSNYNDWLQNLQRDILTRLAYD